MLQQTRVAAVLEHYRRFLAAFPDVGALAAAGESAVLAEWSGLGYYRRARLLHRAARQVAAERGGAMPRTEAELRALPGVGAYTAAAVASIAFGEPAAVVDGNVERVLARIAGWSAAGPGFAARVRGLAASMLDRERPGEFNQAVMELGATVCLPRGPRCPGCPCRPWCRTRGEHAVAARPRQRREASARAVWLRGQGDAQAVRLVQRPAESALMAGLWELPLCTPAEAEEPCLAVRHSITVTDHAVAIYLRRGDAAPPQAGEADAWVPLDRLAGRPLTGLTRKVLRRLGLLA
jgi:A/G-specific adenine glycosylase